MAVLADCDAGLEPVELVLQLCARAGRRAAHQHLAGERGRAALAGQRLQVAEPQGQVDVSPAAAGLLRQQRQLQAAGHTAALGARIDVSRRGIEGFAFALAASPL